MMMGRAARAGLLGMVWALLAMAAIGCGRQATEQTDGDDGTPVVDTSEVEAVARAFVEVSGTFDYRDQESQYEQVLPLLADKMPFQENSTAVSTQRIETSRATATRVDAISDDDAIITVTADHFRSFLPYQPSEMVEERVLQQVDCRLVREEGRWLVSRSMILSEEPLPQEEGEPTSSAPTPSHAASTAPAYEEEISKIIKDLVLNDIGPDTHIEDVQVGGKTYYTDSSGTEWIGFTVFPIPEAATDPAFGVIKKPSGGNWELLFVGTGPVGDALPDDVKNGLGIDW